MTSSLTGHGTRRNDKHLRVQFGILCRKWIIFVRPKSIAWLYSDVPRCRSSSTVSTSWSYYSI